MILQSIFQTNCLHCNLSRASDELGLCLDCASALQLDIRRLPDTDYLESMWALSAYHGPMGSLIRRGKYSSRRHIFSQLGKLMGEAALDLPEFDGVVHVPVPWHRRIIRGFDQAEILAQAVHQFLDVPHYPVLRRKGFERQARKEREQRNQNFLGQYVCVSCSLPPRILLIDDTITTGATVAACAATLYQNGAQKLIGFSLGSTQL